MIGLGILILILILILGLILSLGESERGDIYMFVFVEGLIRPRRGGGGR